MEIERCPLCGGKMSVNIIESIVYYACSQCSAFTSAPRYSSTESIERMNHQAAAIRDRIARARREALEEARGIAAVHGLALHAVGRTSDGERALDISDKIRALMEEESDGD
jgi:protein-arginine kinase activator protein McsA